MSWILALVYGVASVLSLAMYAVDKSAAKNNRWRISENTLHAVSLVGGWPGALLAQSLLHHKNRKTSFQIIFWLTVTVNFAALLWFVASDSSGSFPFMK